MEFKLKPEYDSEKNLWNVEITGEIDIYNSTNVKDYLGNLVQEHSCDVHLFCEGLEYIDSTGLGAFVAVLKNVKTYGGNIHLHQVKSNILKVFKITNLDQVFMIEGDKDAK